MCYGVKAYDGYEYGLPLAYDPGMYAAAAGSAFGAYPAMYGVHQQQVSWLGMKSPSLQRVTSVQPFIDGTEFC